MGLVCEGSFVVTDDNEITIMRPHSKCASTQPSTAVAQLVSQNFKLVPSPLHSAAVPPISSGPHPSLSCAAVPVPQGLTPSLWRPEV